MALRERPVGGKKKTPKASRKNSAPPPEVNFRTDLDEELTKRFCKLWEWHRKGDEYIRGNGDPPHFAIYGHFIQAMRKAIAEYRLKNVDGLQESEDWRRFLEILERRDRRTWNKQDPQGGTVDDYEANERFL